jgi:hypothetical protein
MSILRVLLIQCWHRDQDYAIFNARAKEVATMQNEMQQLKLLLQSYEKTQEKLEEDARYCFHYSVYAEAVT